jgi:hypothetical protein
MAHLLISIECDLPKETEGCRIYNGRVHVMVGSGESDRILHVIERDLEKRKQRQLATGNWQPAQYLQIP